MEPSEVNGTIQAQHELASSDARKISSNRVRGFIEAYPLRAGTALPCQRYLHTLRVDPEAAHLREGIAGTQHVDGSHTATPHPGIGVPPRAKLQRRQNQRRQVADHRRLHRHVCSVGMSWAICTTLIYRVSCMLMGQSDKETCIFQGDCANSWPIYI
jgi:hypothetical protein